ncbi:GNAT family N-acetyltransferase [Levilactobacillus namurensis]|uniref:GNAT family N-acetyltransferase n=1 Tax=Levilactobacillus namurensis TaxID=380393 RepID=A0AAW8W3E4_9LACO|nr:GNAT family N-acetyltransferase [Levilactobacillus namurensis]MDT7014536.1 GNAT family N-acetyltransferase [Levilactobacillus namurensis]
MIDYQQITTISPNLRRLLLSADPQWSHVTAALTAGIGWAGYQGSTLVSASILVPHSATSLELANLAVPTAQQRQGMGRAMIAFVLDWAAQQRYQRLTVATGTTSIGPLLVYQKCGFRVVKVEPNYFTRHYQHPIVENGIVLQDRLVLQQAIPSKTAGPII